MLPAKFISRSLFEGVDELGQIGSVGESFTKEMNVVGHDAICVERKALSSGNFHEIIEQPSPSRLIGEKGRAPFGSNRNEINAATEIVPCRKSEAFLKKGHAEG